MTIFSHDARALLEQVRLLREATNEMLHRQRRLQERIEQMPNQVDFQAAKASILGAIDAVGQRVTADIQALKDQLAQGQAITAQDLTELQDSVKEHLDTIDPVPPPPTP